jgi:hypothetical protein
VLNIPYCLLLVNVESPACWRVFRQRQRLPVARRSLVPDAAIRTLVILSYFVPYCFFLQMTASLSGRRRPARNADANSFRPNCRHYYCLRCCRRKQQPVCWRTAYKGWPMLEAAYFFALAIFALA